MDSRRLHNKAPSDQRNSHLTFLANQNEGRHGWLRLTPAYGAQLVRDRLTTLPTHSRIYDPFSGTGTTPLTAAELGHTGEATDVNPFLVWLGNVKLKKYAPDTLEQVTDEATTIRESAKRMARCEALWQPNLHNIDKWWTSDTLQALKVVRNLINNHSGDIRNLLDIAFCRTLIATSNATHNHQSMSFRITNPNTLPSSAEDYTHVIHTFTDHVIQVTSSAHNELPGTGMVRQGDSRTLIGGTQPFDAVVSSPPYVNRMSYIRELRPYMYWLRYLDEASDASELDWKTIGGTWGSATSKIATWSPEDTTPIDHELKKVCQAIKRDGGKNGPLLANYVAKYHHDMWEHFQSITTLIRPGGTVSYIIGNSMFYGHEVPAQKWYANMLRTLGYSSVTTTILRKRNSNKALYEYDISGKRP